MLDESEVLEWMMKQKTDESVEDINREQLFEYMDTKEFLAVVWCKKYFIFFFFKQCIKIKNFSLIINANSLSLPDLHYSI